MKKNYLEKQVFFAFLPCRCQRYSILLVSKMKPLEPYKTNSLRKALNFGPQ